MFGSEVVWLRPPERNVSSLDDDYDGPMGAEDIT